MPALTAMTPLLLVVMRRALQHGLSNWRGGRSDLNGADLVRVSRRGQARRVGKDIGCEFVVVVAGVPYLPLR